MCPYAHVYKLFSCGRYTSWLSLWPILSKYIQCVHAHAYNVCVCIFRDANMYTHVHAFKATPCGN